MPSDPVATILANYEQEAEATRCNLGALLKLAAAGVTLPSDVRPGPVVLLRVLKEHLPRCKGVVGKLIPYLTEVLSPEDRRVEISCITRNYPHLHIIFERQLPEGDAQKIQKVTQERFILEGAR